MGRWRVVGLGSRLLRRFMLCIVGLTAMLNLGSAATMTASMALSLVVYAAAFGLKFAIGFIILLFLHECGHLLASRVVGIKATGPLFIPFLGAVIHLRQPPINAKMEANIAIGGPALGALSALICMACYLWTDSTLMLVLAYAGCLLNLFNLIPCLPLDGGHIAAAISPLMWWCGTIALGIVFFYTYNVFILITLLFSLYWLWKGEEYSGSYYALTIGQRLSVAWWYFGLLSVLSIATLYLVEVLR